MLLFQKLLKLVSRIAKAFFVPPPPKQMLKVQSDEHNWCGVELHNYSMKSGNVELSTRKASCTLPWFFERVLVFEGNSLSDVSAFLARCRAVSDWDLFNKPEWWVHPVDFEETRRGDCEDHALFAWRVLHEMGHDVRLMLGRFQKTGHAWVQLYEQEACFILEATAKGDVHPAHASGYMPEHSFKRTDDGQFIMYGHCPKIIQAADCTYRKPGSRPPLPPLEFPPDPLSLPEHWVDIDRLIFEGKKNEAHRAVRVAMQGKGSHTREFLDRYFYLREHSPESFELDDEAYWADWTG